MVYVNQIHLIKFGVKKNRMFFKELYENPKLTNSSSWFDLKPHERMARESDSDMTVSKFLNLLDSKAYVTLQMASPNPFDIRYGNFVELSGATEFAFIECPYNPNNFEVVSKAFLESFGFDLQSIEPQPGLLEYYNQRVANGF